MLVNFKNDCIAEASMEKFSVPIERGVNTGAQSKHRETQQINQKNNSQVDMKSEILAVELCIDGTHQNKSFCCNFHTPKNLSEHARRRGDVDRILTQGGKRMDIFSLPALVWNASGKRWNPRDRYWRWYGRPSVSSQDRICRSCPIV